MDVACRVVAGDTVEVEFSLGMEARKRSGIEGEGRGVSGGGKGGAGMVGMNWKREWRGGAGMARTR